MLCLESFINESREYREKVLGLYLNVPREHSVRSADVRIKYENKEAVAAYV